MDASFTHIFNQSLKACLNVLHPALVFPMSFCWEVDHITGVVQPVEIINEHFSRLQFLSVAHCLVAFEIIRKGFLELEGEPTAHNPDTVDGVYQALGIGSQDITLFQFNHEVFHSWATVSVS